MRPIDAEKLIQNLNMNFDDYAVYSDVFDVIDDAPTLDVAPVVSAHWDEIFEDWRIQISGNKCSSCGYEYYGDYHNYCPHCGAKMDDPPADWRDNLKDSFLKGTKL